MNPCFFLQSFATKKTCWVLDRFWSNLDRYVILVHSWMFNLRFIKAGFLKICLSEALRQLKNIKFSYSLGGQVDGQLNRPPDLTYCNTSTLLLAWYGCWPNDIISQSRTPKDQTSECLVKTPSTSDSGAIHLNNWYSFQFIVNNQFTHSSYLPDWKQSFSFLAVVIIFINISS